MKTELSKMMYLYDTDELPLSFKYISEEKTHSHETCDRNLASIHKHDVKIYNSSLLCKGTTSWSTLPPEIKKFDHPNSFKNKKKHFKMVI